MLLAVYAAAFVATVLLGARLARRILGSHRRTQLVMSFVSGIMLGVAVFHLLPHALYVDARPQAVDHLALWLMTGLVSMFLLQRVFHFHQHEDVAECDVHEHGHQHQPLHLPAGQFGGAGVLFGLAVHALLDGVALAAAMQVEWQIGGGDSQLAIAGLGVFLAILLHKPLDAMTIVLFAERRKRGSGAKNTMLLAYALICPLTAALLLYALPASTAARPEFVAAALAFSAGMFLCIALGDLLPEIHFHDHDRLTMTTMLMLGIALAWSLKHVESLHEGHAAASPWQVRQLQRDNVNVHAQNIFQLGYQPTAQVVAIAANRVQRSEVKFSG